MIMIGSDVRVRVFNTSVWFGVSKLNKDSDLNGTVVFVGCGQTERTESPIAPAGNRVGIYIAV